MTPGEEADITSHSRSSSRSRFSIAANGSNPATLASPMSEPGPRKGESPSLAKSLWLRRSHSTKVPSSLHAARPSVPGTLETSSSQEINSSSSPPLSASHLASLGASSPHPRSAPAKRQPASRSSHGIETFNGPPPALSTQRSYTTDVTRRRPAPPNLILNRPSLRGRSHTDSWIDTNASRRSLSVDDRTRVVPWIDPGVGRINGEKTKVGMDSVVVSHQSLDDDTDRTLCSLRSDETSPTWRAQGEPAQPDENSQYLQDDQHPETTVEDGESKLSQEDLFLNLAKSDTLAHDAAESSSRSESKSERRRVSSVVYYFSTWLALPGYQRNFEFRLNGGAKHMCACCYTAMSYKSWIELIMNSRASAYQPRNSRVRHSNLLRDYLPAGENSKGIWFRQARTLRALGGVHRGICQSKTCNCQ